MSLSGQGHSPASQTGLWAIRLVFIAMASRVALFVSAYVMKAHLGIDGDLHTALCQWDCAWYRQIAENGYPSAEPIRANGQEEWAFYPVFPAIAGSLAWLTGLQPTVAGLIVSNVFFVATPPILYVAYREVIGHTSALFLGLLLITSPLSLFSSLMYTEATFGLLLALLFWAGLGRRWLLAGVCCALLSATRAVGLFAVVPFLVMAFQSLGPSHIRNELFGLLRLRLPSEETGRVWLGFMLAPMGFFLYMLFLHLHVGDGFASRRVVEAGWGWEWRAPWSTLIDGFSHFPEPRDTYLAVTALLGVILCGVLFLKQRFAEGSYYAIALWISFSGLLTSAHRYAFGAFLPFLAIALFCEKRPGLMSTILVFLLGTWGIFLLAWLSRETWIV